MATYNEIINLAKELANEDLKAYTNKAGYLRANDKAALFQKYNKKHKDYLTLFLKNKQNFSVEEYKDLAKTSIRLANEDLKAYTNKAGYLRANDKAALFNRYYEEHFSNLLKIYLQLGKTSINQYANLLNESISLANEDLKAYTNKAGYLRANDKAALFKKYRVEHLKALFDLKLGDSKEKPPLSKMGTDCFISKRRSCKSKDIDNNLVFIAGSSDEEFKEDVEKIIQLLKEKGYKPYFATYNEEFNEDAFCTKICSKMLTSKFCIVMLNSPYHHEAKKHSLEVRFPSANVYFEYGMMTVLKKKIIPTLKKGQKLPFNVQHLDILIYNNLGELSSKLKKNI